ncbi:hypothetical protein SAMN06298224_2078 [Fibrobacter sp. UWB16]|uniref:hypothetical protein n=1 Tax=unclassified Fibrobacter TaxID=2634177 RepID=UPI000B5219E9|nr:MULTISPECIES: hypothetical protein [unclassified Fibrobacter]OWV17850.1 hypothetical protein B7991_11560 [Fibrobacter sp. UWB3]SOD15572.1 hypothetical protein SAMN06298224_2078 [Fibrobacter sp. UWB16]
MMFNKKISAFGLSSAILLSAATAFAAENQTEVVTQQKSLLEKLDSLNAAVLGLKINGTAKAGVLASFASSDQFADNSPTQENQAFTDVNLRLTARPSSETMIDVQLRLHKDWQSAYDENNNPVIGHWFSYDGTILNKHVDFNLGYMRVGYTPLTINTPQTEVLQEPEIFAEKRREALAQRNLDTTSRRLLHGLNVAYQSGSVGAVDNITAQLTGARLRNTAKKADQLFFDFDFSDRYLLGARAGVEAYGAHVGLNYVNAFDRKQTRRSKDLDDLDTIYYEKNQVFSADIAFDSKKVLPQLPITFGLNGEFAMSNWKVDRDYNYTGKKVSYRVNQATDANDKQFAYVKSSLEKDPHYVNEEYLDLDGKSFYADVFAKGNVSDVDFKVSAGYFQTDSNFWSEMASSPVYQGRSTILNTGALYTDSSYADLILGTFGASSLENLYFSVYNSTTLQAGNLMSSGKKNILSEFGSLESPNLFYRLDNNYKNGHFYRNGYTSNIAKKRELDPLTVLDPSVGLALPLGMATPDRKGITAKADVNWADKVFFNARVNLVTQGNLPSFDAEGNPITIENKFTEFAVGLGVDAGALAGLDRKILVQGSFSNGSEDSYLNRKVTRIVAGVTADVWGPISVLAGFQMYEKKFGDNGYTVASTDENGAIIAAAAVTKASEQLIMGGVRVKLAPISYLTVQYGMLKNDLDFNVAGLTGLVAKQISISKNVILADVTVNF